ncbi:hypothetical protein [Streptomyces sp. NPDC017993]|uniref:hypothetical protein n=1 Tax=Streptomyces sp. NPDC017993 TaxID=3365027 RepID=UPI0037AB76A4
MHQARPVFAALSPQLPQGGIDGGGWLGAWVVAGHAQQTDADDVGYVRGTVASHTVT